MAEDTGKAREFLNRVRQLALEYDLDFFIVTEGASAISSRGTPAVEHARRCHEEWERQHNIDPEHDWNKE